MTFDPTSVEVTGVTLPKDHCVQVPWEYINVCGYSDEFCKLPHTYTHILRTYYVHTTYYILHTTYRISDHIVSLRRDKKWVHFSSLSGTSLPKSYLSSPPPRGHQHQNFGGKGGDFGGKKSEKKMHAERTKICCFCHFYAKIVKFGPILQDLSLFWWKMGGGRGGRKYWGMPPYPPVAKLMRKMYFIMNFRLISP